MLGGGRDRNVCQLLRGFLAKGINCCHISCAALRQPFKSQGSVASFIKKVMLPIVAASINFCQLYGLAVLLQSEQGSAVTRQQQAGAPTPAERSSSPAWHSPICTVIGRNMLRAVRARAGAAAFT